VNLQQQRVCVAVGGNDERTRVKGPKSCERHKPYSYKAASKPLGLKRLLWRNSPHYIQTLQTGSNKLVQSPPTPAYSTKTHFTSSLEGLHLSQNRTELTKAELCLNTTPCKHLDCNVKGTYSRFCPQFRSASATWYHHAALSCNTYSSNPAQRKPVHASSPAKRKLFHFWCSLTVVYPRKFNKTFTLF